MRSTLGFILILKFVFLLGCLPDVPVCTTFCAAAAACHSISGSEAAQAIERDCVTTCSYRSTYGTWDVECDGTDSEGFCNDWDSSLSASAEDWEQHHLCVVQFAECRGVEYWLSDDDFEYCLDYLQ